MPRWATVATITSADESVSIDLSACRTLILGGEDALAGYGGSSVQAADGTPHVQTIFLGTRGLAFGFNLKFCPADKLAAVVALVRAALESNTFLRVQAQDAVTTFACLAVPDFTQRWITKGQESEGIVDDVTFRFLSVSA